MKSLLRPSAVLFCAFTLSSCETSTPGSAAVGGEWWSEPWDDAASQRSQSVELASGIRVAARSVRILERDESGAPTAIRAKGNALMQSAATPLIRALGDQVDATGDAVQVSGSPSAVQGTSQLLATSADTVITIQDNEMGVIGPAKLETVVGSPPALRKSAVKAKPSPSQTEAASSSPVSPAAPPSPVRENAASEKAKPAPAAPPASVPVTPKPKPVPAPAPPPAPELPKMRLPDDDGLPIPGL